MKHFSRANTVTNLDAERLLPAMIEFDRQGLSRRITKADARQVMDARVFGVEHRIDHRRHGRENRGPITFDHFEHLFRRRAFGKERGCAANCKREQQIRSRGVSKKEFGDRDS